jgi:hypothetical protein
VRAKGGGDLELGTVLGTAFSARPSRSTASSGSRSSIDRSRYTSLDFGLQVLHPVADPGEGRAAYDIDELYVHAAGAMYTSSDIYGLTSNGGGTPPEGGETPPAGGEDSSECVICLTEAQDIFLLPCR